ncbi:MAG: hypothetical protein R3300_05955 [Candidatus Promineifilaceae bacterium]|nr:hypothetical protein [Candidatus Promineifilaceae bacterium]
MVTQAQIQATIAQQNLVIRNLQVTLGYHRLSQGMRKLIGSRNVSWCGFAAHASKTAGQALRHENMPRFLKAAMMRMAGYDDTFFYLNDVLGQPERTFTKVQNSLLAEAMKRVSLLISAGNILVYQELAWPFSRLIVTFSRSWDRDDAALREFLQGHFKPGPLEREGQNYLIEAFSAYYNARFETDRKRKAEYVFQGNLLVGLHEQTRLQPYIEQALAVPYEIFVAGRQDEGAAAGRRADRMRDLVTKAVTRMLMAISLPNRDLKLGEDVIAPSGVVAFPEDLVTIADPRCRALANSFDFGLDTLSGSAADDWVSLKDRMGFVVDFFRSHQQYKRMFEAPFLDSQIPAIDAGLLPAGPL